MRSLPAALTLMLVLPELGAPYYCSNSWISSSCYEGGLMKAYSEESKSCTESIGGASIRTTVTTETCGSAVTVSCERQVTQDGTSTTTNCFCSNSASTSASGPCVCNSGFTGPDGGLCVGCAAGKYKGSPGSEACDECAAGKYSLAGATACINCEQISDPCNRYVVSWHDGTALSSVYNSMQPAWEKFMEKLEEGWYVLVVLIR